MLLLLNNLYPVFMVSVVSNYHDEMRYYYVGKHNDKYKTTFDLIENQKTINTQQKEEIIKAFDDERMANQIIDQYKDIECIFVYDLIKLDDNIYTIQNKIFFYTSDDSLEFYPISNNQMLWFDNGSKRIVLSEHWQDYNGSAPIDYKTPKIDSKITSKSGNIISGIQTESFAKHLLGDLLDFGSNIEGQFVLNVSFYHDEYEFYSDKVGEDKAQTKKMINGHYKKFWPSFVHEIDLKETKDLIKSKKKQYEYEAYQDSLIMSEYERIRVIPKSKNKCDPCITQIRFVLKPNKQQKIDLPTIFNYLRANLSEQYIFVKYQDPNWDLTHPISSLWKDAVSQRRVDSKQLAEDWIKCRDISSEIFKTKNVITLKILNYQADNTYHYANVKFHQNGNIQLDASYKETIGASFEDITDLVNRFINILTEINSMVMRKTKISIPHFNYIEMDNGTKYIEISDNFMINNINTSSNFTSERVIEFESLDNFTLFFQNYLSKTVSDRDKTGITYYKYKKVSMYKEMDEITDKIMKLMERSFSSDEEIIHAIAIKYQLSFSEVQELINKIKQSHYMQDSGDKWTQSGILISYQNGKIQMKFAKTISSLLMANVFSRALLNLYLNREYYYKDKKFKKHIDKIDDIIEIQKNDEEIVNMIDNESNNEYAFSNVNNNNNRFSNINTTGINNININNNNNFGNIDGLETKMDKEDLNLLEDNQMDSEMLDDMQIGDLKGMKLEDKLDFGNKLRKAKGEATDSQISKDIRPTCDDYLPETNTCADFCNDNSFILRRLLRKDPRLFDLGKNIQYSGKAQPVLKHPFVMDYPPDSDPTINPNSFTSYVAYGSNPEKMHYYLCPRAIDLEDMKPVMLDEINNIVERKTRKKSDKCIIGTNKNNGNDVVIRVDISLDKNGKIKKINSEYPYISFLTAIKNIDGLCVPACFKSDHSRKPLHKQCVAGSNEVNISNEKSLSYIFGEKRFPLQARRFGLLSAEWSKKMGSNLHTGQLKSDNYGYVRRGTSQKYKYQSIVEAIADIASDDKLNPIKPTELKQHLSNYLRDNLDVFQSLNHGNIEVQFRKNTTNESIENFIEYLNSNKNEITEEHLLDLCCRKGVLYDTGINIFILTNESIVCPHFMNMLEIYDVSKPTALIIKQKRIFYEPIYYISGNIDIKKIEYLSIFSETTELREIFDMVVENCNKYYDLDWERKLRDQERIYEHTIYHTIDKQPLSLNNTISELEKMKDEKFEFKTQLVDLSMNKTYAVLTENDVVVPVIPQGLLTRLPYQRVASQKVVGLKYNIMKTKLETIANKTKIPVGPLYKVIGENSIYVGKIIGIYLECGRIVYVIPEKNKADNLPHIEDEYQLREYIEKEETKHNTQNYNVSNIVIDEEAEILISKWNFEKESYQLWRYLLSELYRNDLTIRNNIDAIINSEDPVDKKLEDMQKMLKKLMTKFVYVPESNAWMQQFIYRRPEKRLSLQSLEKQELCDNNPHYHRTTTKCKLIINPIHSVTGKLNPHNFLIMVSEEFIRIPFRRQEILNHLIPSVVQQNVFKSYENEILFTESNPTILCKMIDDLFSEVQQKNPLKNMYGKNPTSYALEDKSFYEVGRSNESSIHKYNTERLTSYLRDILGNNLVAIINKNTIFYIIHLISDEILDEPQSEEWFKAQYMDFINNVDIKELYYFLLKQHGEVMARRMMRNKDREELLIDILRDQTSLFNNVKNLSDVLKIIEDDNYVGGIFETYYFSSSLRLNIVMWDMRRKEKQEYAHGYSMSNEHPYLFIYRHNQKNISKQKQQSMFLVYDGKHKRFEYTSIPPKAREILVESISDISDREDEMVKNIIKENEINQNKFNIQNIKVKSVGKKVKKKKMLKVKLKKKAK
jgi:hypothetical protein